MGASDSSGSKPHDGQVVAGNRRKILPAVLLADPPVPLPRNASWRVVRAVWVFEVGSVTTSGSDQSCTVDCDCDYNCSCEPKALVKAPRKRGRRPGDPANTGRPVGLTINCWWGCGAVVSGKTLSKHWRECKKRPKA